jgi:hypothetical protein
MNAVNEFGTLVNLVPVLSFSNILLNAKTNGIKTTINQGSYIIYTFNATTIYRFISTLADANGYPIEDSFYNTLSNNALTDKIAERNL